MFLDETKCNCGTFDGGHPGDCAGWTDDRTPYEFGVIEPLSGEGPDRFCTYCGDIAVTVERITVANDPMGRLYLRCQTHTALREGQNVRVTFWNYRVTREVVGGEDVYAVREFYYENDEIKAWSVDPKGPRGDTYVELVTDYTMFAAAFNHPTLDITDAKRPSDIIEIPLEQSREAARAEFVQALQDHGTFCD